jgi:hypothetical protein
MGLFRKVHQIPALSIDLHYSSYFFLVILLHLSLIIVISLFLARRYRRQK